MGDILFEIAISPLELFLLFVFIPDIVYGRLGFDTSHLPNWAIFGFWIVFGLSIYRCYKLIRAGVGDIYTEAKVEVI